MGIHDKYILLDRFGQGSLQIPKSPMDSDLAYESRCRDYSLARMVHQHLSPKMGAYEEALRKWQDGVTPGKDPPGILTPNASLYRLWGSSVRLLMSGVMPDSYRSLSSEIEFFESADHVLSPDGVPPITRSSVGRAGTIVSDGRIGAALWAIGEDLLNTYESSVGQWEESKKSFLDGCTSPKPIPPIRKHIHATCMGYLTHIQVGSLGYIVPSDHLVRLVDSFRMLRNFAAHMSTISGFTGGITRGFMRTCLALGTRDQAGVGEALRVARAYYVAKLSVTHALGDDPAEVTLESYEGDKLRDGKAVISWIQGITESAELRVTIAHGYKYVLDPDIDMVQCFGDAEETREANPAQPNTVDRLGCHLMRSVYNSMHKDGKYLRLEVRPGMHEDELVDMTSADRPDLGRINDIPIIRWGSVRFSLDEELSHYQDNPPKVKDRAHAEEVKPVRAPIETKYDSKRLSGDEPEIREYKRFRKGNDILKFQKRGHEYPVDTAIQRFLDLVEAHVVFEESLRDQYLTPEDIPSVILEDFLFKHPEACHYVLTEPKAGEMWKRYGRIFYMACEAIKLKLSLVEKLCRELSRHQVGNSLVASHRRRAKDLNHLAHATNQCPAGHRGICVSFDMVKFSKKFSMANIRRLGGILADITGDESLRRLDIIFRSAIVGHSTRGVEGLFGGVSGGFEGFLNFAWTLIHTSIMEMALADAGRYGLVLAFSDDGLLYFLVRAEEDHIVVKRIVEDIRAVYKDCGLVFHVGKTLVAGDVFEYLGEVATGGRLVEMGIKSLSRLGVVEVDSAINLFSERVSSICGQARSAIRTKCEGVRIMPILYTEIHRRMKRLAPDLGLTPQESLMIMMTPRSAGGLGVPCYHEVALVSEEDAEEWFLYKVVRLSHLIEKILQRAARYISRNLISEDTPTMAMLLGSRLETRAPRLSGRQVRQKIAQKFAQRAKMELPGDPLDEARVNELQGVLSCMRGMPPSAFRSLLDSSPIVRDYERAIAVTRSRGASRILRREELRRIQASDTRLCRKALTLYTRELRRGQGDDLIEFLVSLQGRGERLGFRSLRLPILTTATVRVGHPVGLDESSVTQIVDLTAGMGRGSGGVPAGNARDLLFFAPAPWRRPEMSNVISVMSAEGDIPRRFVEIASRIIREDPSLYPHMVAIGSIMEVSLPPLPADVQVSLDRLREYSRGKQSLDINVPDIIQARGVTEFSSRLRRDLSTLGGGTRSLIVAHATIATSDVAARMEVLQGCGQNLRVSLFFENPTLIRETHVPLISIRPPHHRPGGAVGLAVGVYREIRSMIRDYEVEMETMELGQIGTDRRAWVARMIGWRTSRSITSILRDNPTGPITPIQRQTDDHMVTRSIATYASRYAYSSFLEQRRTSHSAMTAQAFTYELRRHSHLLPRFLESPEVYADLQGDSIGWWLEGVKMSDSLFSCIGRGVIAHQGWWSSRVAFVARRSSADLSRMVRGGELRWGDTFRLEPDDDDDRVQVDDAPGLPTVNEVVDTLASVSIVGTARGNMEWEWDVNLIASLVVMMYYAISHDLDEEEWVSAVTGYDNLVPVVDQMMLGIRNPEAWLLDGCSRLAVDHLTAPPFLRRTTVLYENVQADLNKHMLRGFRQRAYQAALRVRDMMDDYVSRHVIVLGRDVYQGPDPEYLLHDSNDAVLSMKPPLQSDGRALIPTPDELDEATPMLQARIAAAHLLVLISFLGRQRPKFTPPHPSDPIMTVAMTESGFPIDHELSVGFNTHAIPLGTGCRSLEDLRRPGYIVICWGYLDERRALVALTTLLAYYEASVTLTAVGSGRNTVTYLHGAVASPVSPPMRFGEPSSVPDEDVQNLMPASAEDHLDYLRMRAGYSLPSHGVSAPRRSSALVRGPPVSSGPIRPSTLMAGEPLLAAASALCTKRASPMQRLWALCLFRSSLWSGMDEGGHSPDDELQLIRDALSAPGDSRRYVMQGVGMDVQTVHSYLMCNPVTAPSSEGSLEVYTRVPVGRIPASIRQAITGSALLLERTIPVVSIARIRADYHRARRAGNEPPLSSLVMGLPLDLAQASEDEEGERWSDESGGVSE